MLLQAGDENDDEDDDHTSANESDPFMESPRSHKANNKPSAPANISDEEDSTVSVHSTEV